MCLPPIDDQPSVAIFNLQATRSGPAAAPVTLGGDMVVMDTLRTQDVPQALPAGASFSYHDQQSYGPPKTLMAPAWRASLKQVATRAVVR
jgi:hypothetical protein